MRSWCLNFTGNDDLLGYSRVLFHAIARYADTCAQERNTQSLEVRKPLVGIRSHGPTTWPRENTCKPLSAIDSERRKDDTMKPPSSILTVAVTGLLLNVCQSSTETYRGTERTATAPSKQETTQSMAETTAHADPQMAAVLGALQSLNPKPIQALS